MSTLYIMCGCPGAGKSTYAQAHYPTAQIFSADMARKELYGDESIQGDGAKVFALLDSWVKTALAAGHDVVYDTTALTPRTRKQILRKFNVPAVCVYINTPIEECKARNAARDRHVPESVIDKMAAKLKTPSLEEGFVDIIEINA